MTRRPTRQIHHRSRDILRPAQSPIRNLFREDRLPALHLDHAGGHLGREEAGGDTVAEDMSRAELDGEVAGEMDDGGWGFWS